MRSRRTEAAVGRSNFNLFATVKVAFLIAIVVLFLNLAFTLYINVSARYYDNPHLPFLRVSSSTSFSSSSLLSNSSSLSSSSSSSSSSPYLCSNSPLSLIRYGPPTLSKESSLVSDTISSPLQSSPPPIQNPNSTSSVNSLASSAPSHPPLTFNQRSPSLTASPPSFFISSSSPIHSLLIQSPPALILQKPSSSYNNFTLQSSSSFVLPPPDTINYNFDRERGKRIGLAKGCNPSKGEWVPDPNAPYYTNWTCRTIQEHQNCMKYGRPNLDFLKWRWKPDGCELPPMEPAEFMRGKNLAFIGDSFARNQMQSLMCLLSRVEYPEEIRHSSSEDGVTQMLYRSYNFTIWAFWSPFLIRAKESMTSNNYGMWNLYLDEPDPIWQPRLGLFDHIVLNTGNWYSRPAQFHEKRKLMGCHYCVFKNVSFMSLYKAHRRAFRTALDAVVGNSQGFTGVTVVRTVSPAHFEGGEWNKGGDCRRTVPFARGGAKLKGMDLELYKDQIKEFWKAKWEGSERGMEFRLLDMTQAMVLRPDGHPSRYGHWPHEKRVLYNDCVHWCLPGPVDMWNDLLFQVLSV